MLDPVIAKDDCTKDSFSFFKEMIKVKILISYDICSLFTSIPLNETIDLAVNLIFDHNSNITKKELQRKILRYFLNLQLQ